MLWAFQDIIEFPHDKMIVFIVWIVSSIVLGLLFLFLHLWWNKRPVNQKYLKVRDEEGILVFIRKNIFLMFSFMFGISVIAGLSSLITWLN